MRITSLVAGIDIFVSTCSSDEIVKQAKPSSWLLWGAAFVTTFPMKVAYLFLFYIH